jgi:hypothetical protein
VSNQVNGVLSIFDDDGGCYVTIFAGPEAERRARDYIDALGAGALKLITVGRGLN